MAVYVNCRPSQMAGVSRGKIYQSNESKAENQTLRAENIAVLVRGYTEAELVKKNCKHLVLRPVYLSDRGNVFESNTAKELALILQACLECDGTPNFECHCDRTFRLKCS